MVVCYRYGKEGKVEWVLLSERERESFEKKKGVGKIELFGM